jgi:hypothetical protein
MLISHRFRFIYLKTRKTAGTSVEAYFEPYCVDPERREPPPHEREAEVTKWGVVGYRGDPRPGEVWFNHMPASRIRELVGDDVWSNYLKFCVVRNPFDKAVSLFWFTLPNSERGRLSGAPFTDVRAAFAGWLLGGARNRIRTRWRGKDHAEDIGVDEPIVTIAGNLVVDDVIRYESLEADLKRMCRTLDIPWESERLERLKSEYRTRPEPFAEYYGRATAAKVRQLFGWELETFGYDLP